MSSESGPDGRKDPVLGSETPNEPETENHDADPAESLGDSEPDRLPPWLGMPDDDLKVSRFSPGMIAGGIAALVIFGVIVWVVYHQAGDRSDMKPPPVITADNAPTKVQPESPGGTDVPNQDKTVYDRINPGAPAQPESILPPPEEPKGLEPQQSGEQSTQQSQSAAPVPTQNVAPTPEPTPPQTAEKTTEAKPAPKPAPKAAPEKAPVAVASRGNYLIQLGAFGDDAGANRAWKALSAKYTSVLGGLKPDIQRADLGARGVFHRLRAGPFETRDGAEAACAKLKAQKQGCLVVTP